MTRFRRYEIAEDSMAPALLPGDYVLAKRAVGQPLRGAIVAYTHPHRSGFELVKRVVAQQGEHVLVTEGDVVINGDPALDPWAGDASAWSGEWTIPRGAVFVLGDQRALSRSDSRDLGPIPIAALHRVIFRYWPLRRIGAP